MTTAADGLVLLLPAVIARLKAHGALTALLDSANAVYEGGAPNPTSGAQPSKYLTVIDPSTTPLSQALQSVGGLHQIQIHIWYPGRLNQPVVAIAAAIAGALDGVKLTLTGHRHWTGQTQLLGIIQDPGSAAPTKHGIVNYEAQVQT